MSSNMRMPITVPLIGSKPTEPDASALPPMGCQVGATESGKVLIEVSHFHGLQKLSIVMGPEEAVGVLAALTQAIEHLRPGMLAGMQRQNGLVTP